MEGGSKDDGDEKKGVLAVEDFVTNRSDLLVTKLKLHKHCAFIPIMLIYCQTVTNRSDLLVTKRREYGEFQ